MFDKVENYFWVEIDTRETLGRQINQWWWICESESRQSSNYEIYREFCVQIGSSSLIPKNPSQTPVFNFLLFNLFIKNSTNIFHSVFVNKNKAFRKTNFLYRLECQQYYFPRWKLLREMFKFFSIVCLSGQIIGDYLYGSIKGIWFINGEDFGVQVFKDWA
jgi:hypothetical protein